MTHDQATQILDQHKEGTHVYSVLTISRALWMTGDLDELDAGMRGQGMAGEIRQKKSPIRGEGSKAVVAENHI